MQTLGLILITARKKKRLSLKNLSIKTKIKENFLKALEQEQWDKLPNFAITAGFIRVVSDVLGLSSQTTVALLRREFPPERPQKIKEHLLLWTPKRTTLVGIVAIIAIIAIYLARQYTIFVAPPPLEVSIQRENNNVQIKGTTNQYATVLVNNEPILLNNGSFSLLLSVEPGQNIIIEALSRSGKSSKKELTAP